jgi:hypothetical protein
MLTVIRHKFDRIVLKKSEKMAMSPLCGGGQDEGEVEEPEAELNFGSLLPNKKARGRREIVKFFDSADWAMKQKNGQGTDGQGTQGDVRYVPESGTGPAGSDDSPLAAESK